MRSLETKVVGWAAAALIGGGAALGLYGAWVDSRPALYDCGQHRLDMNAETTRYHATTLGWTFQDVRTGEMEYCQPYNNPREKLRRVE